MYKLGGGGNLIWHGDKNQLSKKTWLSLKFPLGLIDIFVQWEISEKKEIPGLSVCSMIGMLLRANECIFAWHFKLKWRCVLFINLLSLVVLISAVLPASLHQLAVSPGCQKEFPVWVFGVCVCFHLGFWSAWWLCCWAWSLAWPVWQWYLKEWFSRVHWRASTFKHILQCEVM